MQFCPLCNTQYNDIAKVCPLEHCTNCGSLELQKMRSRSLSSFDKSNLLSTAGALGLMSVFVSLMVYDKYGPVVFAADSLVTGIPAMLLYLTKSRTVKECKSCKAKKFQPVTNVKVEKGSQSESVTLSNESKPAGKSEMIDAIVRIQEKGNRRNFIIGLLSTIGIFVGIVVSIWISHPEFFLPHK